MTRLHDAVWAIYSRRGAMRSLYQQSGWLIAARAAQSATCVVAICWLVSVFLRSTSTGIPAIGIAGLVLLAATVGIYVKAARINAFVFRRYFVLIPEAILLTVVTLMAAPAGVLIRSSAITLADLAVCVYTAFCWALCTTVDTKIPGVNAGFMRY